MNTIRRAEERDIPRIEQLLLQVNMVHHNGRPDLFKGPTTKYTREQLREVLRDDASPVFVSVDAGGEVQAHAFCKFRQTGESHLMMDIKTLYIDDICVLEGLRGQGVGRGMYDFLIGFARENGCYNVELNVWECNPGAKRFYERCGMKPQKTEMETILG